MRTLNSAWTTYSKLSTIRYDKNWQSRYFDLKYRNDSKHRRRKYGGSPPNSLRPKSYFGSIWKLDVLEQKTKVFLGKRSSFTFLWTRDSQ